MFYEASVKCERIQENGATKKVTEKYLCEAVCVSEVELRIGEMISPVSSEFTIKNVKETKIETVLNSSMESFYLVKYGVTSIDGKSGKEKTVVSELLVGSESFEDACKAVDLYMKGTVMDWELICVGLSPIVEVVK